VVVSAGLGVDWVRLEGSEEMVNPDCVGCFWDALVEIESAFRFELFLGVWMCL